MAVVRGGGPWPYIVVLFILVAVLFIGGAAHMVGDGTLRAEIKAANAKVDRTDCDVRWLVQRALAEDRGEPPPPYSPRDCDRLPQ